MEKLRIDYGIDLGTTNSAIARMENGKPQIIKSETLKDTVPSCIHFSAKKKIETIGDKAYIQLARDRQFAMKDNSFTPSAFIEFKRTMGTDEMYEFSELKQSYSSEELSAKLLQKLKSFENNENLNAVVVTIPAKFTINQKDATSRAARLAGFKQIELLQEPIAASFAYGLDSSNKDGIWLVFDLGGGTFDAALLRVEDGIMKVFDTEGDNKLGGKDIDYAIVDEFIIPHLSKTFSIESFFNSAFKHKILRDAWKATAEEAKIQLSFKDNAELVTDLGEDFGVDDEGTPFELDLTLTEAELERIEAPIFQRAIDITKKLLKRNNLTGSQLDTIILVGGPTYSPILRRMVKEQISERIDFSVDPMTVVARGAALYASTIPISEEILDETRDRAKIQLEIKHEPMTVEDTEFVTIKTLPAKTESKIPDSIFVELARNDKAWTSERLSISATGELFEVKLNPGKINIFQVNLFDDKGNRLMCEPENISIIQGSVVSSAPLSYSYGIALHDKFDELNICRTIKGLEKNAAQMPARGTSEKLKTQKTLRPGNPQDIIKIPFYEMDSEADNSRDIYNNHVYDFVITGEDVEKEIPAFSEVELNFSIKGESVSCTAHFPKLNITLPLRTPQDTVRKEKEMPLEFIKSEINRAYNELEELQDDFYADGVKVEEVIAEVDEINNQIEKSGFETDTRSGALDKLRACFRRIDELIAENQWTNLEDEILHRLKRLEEVNELVGNARSTRLLIDFQRQSERIIEKEDIKLGKELLENIKSLFFSLTWFDQAKIMLESWRDNFVEINWKDATEVLKLLNQGFELIKQKADLEQFRPVILNLIDLLPENEQTKWDKSLLLG